MRSHNHVFVLYELTQHFQNTVFRQFFALVFALHAKTQIHEEGCGVLQTVFRQVLMRFLLEGLNDPLDHVFIDHDCLCISPQTELLKGT